MSRNKNRNRYSGNEKRTIGVDLNHSSDKEEKKEEQKHAIPFVPSENDIMEAEKEAEEAVEAAEPVELDSVEEVLEEAIEKISFTKEEENAIEKVSDILSEDEPRIPTEIKEDRPVLPPCEFKVTASKLRIRKEPSKNSDVIKLLNENDIITTDPNFKNNDWAKVVPENGYVMKEFISRYV